MTDTIERPGSGRLSSITLKVKEAKMNEATATQLHYNDMLLKEGIKISLRIILRCRTSSG